MQLPLLTDLFSLFYPRLCVVCGDALRNQEDHLCLPCSLKLPKTYSWLNEDNAVRDMFRGVFPLVNAASYLQYNKAGMGPKIVAEIKYRGNVRFGRYMGALIAKEMQDSGFFETVDCLVPVPLHLKKLYKRGFNQSRVIAEGVASVTGIPVETKSFRKKKQNETQTRKDVYSRWLNSKDLFAVLDESVYKDKHILLVDDVLTTGSTLHSCMSCFREIPQVKISILTVAIA